MFNIIEPGQQLLITGDPMNDRVRQVLLLLSLFSARGKLALRFLLETMREFVAVLDAGPAHTQAIIHFGELPRHVVEAVHAATSRLEIHHVELLVQKSVKADLPYLEPLVHMFEHLGAHILNGILSIFVEPEELTHLLGGLGLRVEIHLCVLLQFLPGLVLVFSPVGLLLVLEKSWFFLFHFLLLPRGFGVEFLLGRSLFGDLLLENVEVGEVDVVVGLLVHDSLSLLVFVPLQLFGGLGHLGQGLLLLLLLGVSGLLIFIEVDLHLSRGLLLGLRLLRGLGLLVCH